MTSPSSDSKSRASSTSFLGRQAELGELMQLLENERLVTLTGAPGIGKSRLSLELAGWLDSGFTGGVSVVELAPVTAPEDVPRAIAATLSVDEQSGQRLIDTIVARLQGRHRLILIDNCEHLLATCAEQVAALLDGCPQLRILATSREPLGLAAERVWQVPPLPVPDEGKHSLEMLGAQPAARLFVERAQAVRPGFTLNAYVAPAVAEICRRLDGIPLAIELAAARVGSVTAAEIARRLDDRFAR